MIQYPQKIEQWTFIKTCLQALITIIIFNKIFAQNIIPLPPEMK